jgi:hypothetical protein
MVKVRVRVSVRVISYTDIIYIIYNMYHII